MHRARTSGLAVLVLCAAGCGDQAVQGDGGSNGGDGPNYTLGGTAGHRVTMGALCDFMVRCPQGDRGITFRNRSECMAIMDFTFTCRLEEGDTDLEYALIHDIPPIDEARASSCADYLATAPCESVQNYQPCADAADCEVSPGAAACAEIFGQYYQDDEDDGRASLGELCSGNDCKDDYYCGEPPFLSDVGAFSCQVCLPKLTAGEHCSSEQPCADGLHCLYVDDAYYCVPDAADGAACSSSELCASDFCHPVDLICDPGGWPGDPCTSRVDCRDAACDDGTNRCVAFRENGEACSSSQECRHENCDAGTSLCGLPLGAACTGSSTQCASGRCDSASSTCSAPAAPGEACTEDLECATGWCSYSSSGSRVCQCQEDEDCGADQFCDWSSNACQDKRSNGSSCDDDAACLSSFCTMNETCAERPGLGDACSSSYECGPRAYCGEGRCKEALPPDSRCEQLDSCAQPFVCFKGRCQPMNISCEPASAGQMCTLMRVCDADAYCDMMGGFECKARSRAGEACTTAPYYSPDYKPCLAGLYCAAISSDGSTICEPRSAAGEACSSTEACLEGLRCVDSLCGASEIGRACSEYGGEPPCPPELYCNGRDDTCQAYLEPGEDCSDYYARCAAGLFCSSVSYPEVCALPGVEGEACAEDAHCAADLFCDSSSYPRTCARPAAQGGECDQNEHQHRDCATGLYCDESSYPSTCLVRPSEGETCDRDTPCLEGLYCDDSTYPYTCQPRPDQGEACDDDVPCQDGLYCSDYPYTCEQPRAVGESCQQDQECATGICARSRRCANSAQCVMP